MIFAFVSVVAVLSSVIMTLAFFLYKATKKLIAVDDLLQTLMHDISVNLKYFGKLLSTPLFNNSQEVIIAMQNMKIMKDRLEEFSMRFTEILSTEEPKSEKDKNVLHE